MSMLKTTVNPFFWTNATFRTPDENGEMQEVSIRVKLAYKDSTDYQNLLYGEAAKKPDGTGDAWLAPQVLLGWVETQVGDQDGKPLPFNVDNVQAMLKAHKPLASAIARAWISGQVGAAAQGN